MAAPPPDAPPLRGSSPRAALLRLAGLAVLIALLLLGARLAGLEPTPAKVRELGAGLGDLGPLLYMPLAIVLNSLFVPSPVICGAAGLLFGTTVGFLVALPATVLGAAAQMLLTRHFGGPGVRRLVPERLRGLDAFLERRGFLAVLYVRLVPGLPFVSANYATGLTRLRARDLMAGTALGKGPRIWAYVTLGGSFDDLGSPQARIAVGLLVAMGVLGLLLGGRQLRRERVGAGEAPPTLGS